MKAITTPVVLLVISIFIPPSLAEAALFQNGSFQDGLNGWTIVQNSGGDGIGNGYQFNEGQVYGDGIISQTFDTSIGTTYSVSFNFHSLGGPASGYSQQLQVEVRDGVSATNGNEIITAGSAQVAPGAKAGFSMSQNGSLINVTDIDASNPNTFSTVSFRFVAQSGSSTIVFSDQTGSAGQFTDGALSGVQVLASGQCVSPPSGIVAWWPGEGNANDIIGTNNGTLVGGVTFTSGEVGQAFSFDGSGGYIQMPPVTQGLPNGSVEFWFNLNSWDWSSASNGLYFWAGTEHSPSDESHFDGINFGTHQVYTSTDGELLFGIYDLQSNWNWVHSGVVPQTNTWYHVAGTWGQGGICIYVNGVLKATNPYTGSAPNFCYYNLIGRSSWPATSINGLVDEVSIYNRALTSNEVAAIYVAGSSGKCYLPTITQQPQSQLGYWGKSVTFSVAATNGIPPLSYQWLYNSAPILNATNSSLVLTNLQATNAGAYIVIVSDSGGNSVTSSPPAILTVNSAGVGIALYAGVTINGVVGQTYGVQFTTNLGNTNSWAGLTNLTLNVPQQIWYDSQPASQAQRYYRVVAGPISIP